VADWGKVTKIIEMSRITPAGEIVKYYRHSIMTAGGASLTVDISEADFTADRAEPILRARAEEADKILSL